MSNLKQTGANADYQTAFETLQNKVVGVPDRILLELYIAGLRQPLQGEVQLHQPASLASAFALAKHLTACRPEQFEPPPPQPRRQWIHREGRTGGTTVTTTAPTASSAQAGGRTGEAASRANDVSKLPIVRISAADKADRTRRGVCWYCEEKWSPTMFANAGF